MHCSYMFFETTAGNTVEIFQKYEIHHEIYNMQLIVWVAKVFGINCVICVYIIVSMV